MSKLSLWSEDSLFLRLGSAPRYGRWHADGRKGVENLALVCVSCVTLAMVGDLPEFLSFSVNWGSHAHAHFEGLSKGWSETMYVEIFETTLKEAPRFQLSKFPAFKNVGIRQEKQYGNCKATT